MKRKPSWLDSSNKQVQKDLLALVREVARQGVDEIQMDYIRFPTQGKLSGAIIDFQAKDSLYAKQDSNYVFRRKEDIMLTPRLIPPTGPGPPPGSEGHS